MPSTRCRLCLAPLPQGETDRGLCPVCDDYVQHLALRSDRNFDEMIDDVRGARLFQAASKRAH
jgi:hypothetical protein